MRLTIERIAMAIIIAATLCFVSTQMRACNEAESTYWAERARVK